jgi:isoleucyl-tRNA synthetase
VIYRILDGLLRLMAPILCFTAAEAWEHLHDLAQDAPLERSIFFVDFPQVDDIARDELFSACWDRLLTLRSGITRVLEGARRDKIIGLSLDAEVILQADAESTGFLKENLEQLRELCIVSSLRLVDDNEEKELTFVEAESLPGVKIAVGSAPGVKCERCWTIATTVGDDQEHPSLCARCAVVVRQLAG